MLVIIPIYALKIWELRLKEKSKYVYWNNEKRQEYFAVVAKK